MNEENPDKNESPSEIIYSSVQSSIAAAETGDLDALHHVGACYATGDWDGPKDEAEAIKWYTRAAEAGHTLSQYDLGFMLILGEGTDKNVERGMWWMEQAARSGETNAARLLSDLFTMGLHGVEPDPEKASYWSKIAGDFEDGI